MKRNNSSKIGNLEDGSTPQDSVVSSAAANTPDVSFIVPKEIVNLPTYGLLYPEGHPLCGVSTIEMKHMTAKEEDILTNTSYIKKGIVLDRLLSSLVVDKSINLDSLAVTDKNALLIAARVSAYGKSYMADTNCPVCTAKNTINIDLDEVLDVAQPDFEDLPEGVQFTENKTFLVTLPKSGFVFEIRPRIGADDRELEERKKRAKKLGLPNANRQSGLSESFEQITVSVNGDPSPGTIRMAFENLPAYDFRHLRSAVQDCIPNVNLYTMLECSECGAEEVIGVPMNADFFWPDIKVQRKRL